MKLRSSSKFLICSAVLYFCLGLTALGLCTVPTQAWYYGFKVGGATGNSESAFASDRMGNLYASYYYQLGGVYHADFSKLTASGALLWTKDFQNTTGIFPSTLTIDTERNVYFGMNIFNKSYSAEVDQYDPLGNFIRKYDFTEPTGQTYIVGAGRDQANNFYVGLYDNQVVNNVPQTGLHVSVHNMLGTQVSSWLDNKMLPEGAFFTSGGLCLGYGLDIPSGTGGVRYSLYNVLGQSYWSRVFDDSFGKENVSYTGAAIRSGEGASLIYLNQTVTSGSSNSYHYLLYHILDNGLTSWQYSGVGYVSDNYRWGAADDRGGAFVTVLPNPTASTTYINRFDSMGMLKFSAATPYAVTGLYGRGRNAIASYINMAGTPYLSEYSTSTTPDYTIAVMLGGGAAHDIESVLPSCCDCCCCDDSSAPNFMAVLGGAYIGDSSTYQSYVASYYSGTVFDAAALTYSAVVGGGANSIKVELDGVAGESTRVYLHSNNSAATVPTYATVAPGATYGYGAIATTPVNADQTVTITANEADISKTVTFQIRVTSIKTFSLNTTAVNGGSPITGKISLNGIAASSGVTVAVTSDHPTVIADFNVHIGAGQYFADFSQPTTAPSGGGVTVTLTATAPDGTKETQQVAVK